MAFKSSSNFTKLLLRQFLITAVSAFAIFAHSKDLKDDELPPEGLVEVEQSNILPSDLSGNKALVPYQIRRKDWANLISVTYSTYHPVNYESDYVSDLTFDEIYGKSPMIEAAITYKYNFILGSIGGEVAYGYYTNVNDSPTVAGDAKLDLQMLRAGIRFTLDNMREEPVIAPYGIGGVYALKYDEIQESKGLHGATAPGVYFGGGVMLQLNALDPYSATEAYVTGGIENTFFFVEARTYMASTNQDDPDFSTGLDLNGGLTVEF